MSNKQKHTNLVSTLQTGYNPPQSRGGELKKEVSSQNCLTSNNDVGFCMKSVSINIKYTPGELVVVEFCIYMV